MVPNKTTDLNAHELWRSLSISEFCGSDTWNYAESKSPCPQQVYYLLNCYYFVKHFRVQSAAKSQILVCAIYLLPQTSSLAPGDPEKP